MAQCPSQLAEKALLERPARKALSKCTINSNVAKQKVPSPLTISVKGFLLTVVEFSSGAIANSQRQSSESRRKMAEWSPNTCQKTRLYDFVV